jgi:putative lysine transport system permease protein
MLKVLKRVIAFALFFGIIIIIIPKNDAQAVETQTTENEFINEAMENLRFYSSFNNQTLTQDKLNRITMDFFLPINYQDIDITYVIDSKFLTKSSETETISLRSSSGNIDIEVIRVQVEKLPNIIQGNQSFSIFATFTLGDESYQKEYTGYVNPVIPEDFLGGSLYTLVRYGRMFIDGAIVTIGISLVGTLIGFILALFLATARLIESNPQDKNVVKILKNALNKLSSFYITIFRGTPMIVQASFFWYGFGLFNNALLCGLFVVSLNTAAYIAEIIRGGVNSIDEGQSEAGLSLGMSYSQTMIFVVLPQAIKNSMPAIGNEFVINIKDTSVLSVIGIFELFNQTKKITGLHYRQLEAYAIVALIYLVLTYSTTSILMLVEKKMGMKPIELVSSN